MPKIIFSKTVPKTAVTVFFASHNSEKFSLLGVQKRPDVSAALKLMSYTGDTDSFITLIDPLESKRIIGVVGLGSSAGPAQLRNAAAVAVRNLSSHKQVAFLADGIDEESLSAIAEGALLGSYQFSLYKSKPTNSQLSEITLVTSLKVKPALGTQAKVIAEAVETVKNLVNTPPNDLFPASFASNVKTLLKGSNLSVAVWDEKKLAAEKCGGILGVGQGSSRPPRLVRISYTPAKAKKNVALVGKGITFDTGGLSLKTGAGMIGMKYDMTGAATALAVIHALSQLKTPISVTAWLCLAENMPSSTAIRPNDVLTIRGGKTVEVLNTDAEGRLVLADGLQLASEENPDLIIDVATLTGAATTALGTRYTGAMGDQETISHLVELGEGTGEHFWHMPLPEELRSYLNSDVADIANVKPGNTAAGMLVGATFLKEFVGLKKSSRNKESIPWVHLDIANTANNAGSAYGVVSSGPTGVAVRTLIRLLQKLA